MLRVGVHVTVSAQDGTPIVEIMSTQTVISPNHKDPLEEIRATVETLDRLVDDGKDQYHSQMMDFSKVVADS